MLNKFFKKNNRKKYYELRKNPFLIVSGRFSSRAQSVYRPGWSEDVYIDDSSSGKEMVGGRFDFSKIVVIYLFLFSLLFILLLKIAWLQIVKGEYYYSMSEGNRIRIQRIEPRRGVIYDRNNNLLVRNNANFMLYFIPADLPDDQKELDLILNEISLLTSVDLNEIDEILATVKLNTLEAYQPLFVTDDIIYDNALSLYLKSENWSGVIIDSKFNRKYLNIGKVFNYNDDLEKSEYLSLSHILGYTGKINKKELENANDEYLSIDYIGKMGVEFFWENELKGVSGKKIIEVDALGKEKKILDRISEEDGHNLILSLDVVMQEKLEEILVKNLNDIDLRKASAIVMDPNNGEILAMVSLPAFNSNLFAQGISQKDFSILTDNNDRPLFNRSVSGEFPSGSTIKLVVAAAALQEGIISENTTFLSNGGIKIGQWYFPDWQAGGHGRTNVTKAIAQSVNTFFYIIGGGYEDFDGLGIDRLVKYYEKFGLGEQLGVDLAGEADGLVPSREWKQEKKNEPWYIGDTYHISIGQGDLIVTPLQVAVYTSFFANGGKIYRPHFVKEILSSGGDLIQKIEGETIRADFVDSYNIEVVRRGMREAVLSGSARSLLSLPVKSAGKTGTAQWHTKKKPHAWFTSFAPYDDTEIVVTVLVEEGEEGSTVATPVAREFMNWYFREYNPREET